MAVKKVVKKRKEIKNVDKGQVHIKSSFNNTIVTVTDANGNAIAQCSAGALGYRGLRLPLSRRRKRLRKPLWNTGFVPSKCS